MDNNGSIYELQHEIWSGWSRDTWRLDCDAHFLIKKIGVKKYDRVWDLGCGSGQLCLSLSKMGVHSDGLDISHNLISLANKKIKKNYMKLSGKVSFTVGDFENINLDKKPEYVVFWDSSINVLETEEMYSCIKRIRESELTKESIVIIEMLNPNYFHLRPKLQFEYPPSSYSDGVTTRKYLFDKKNNTLEDDITYKKHKLDKNKILIKQTLTLYPIKEVIKIMGELQYSSLEIWFMKDYEWFRSNLDENLNFSDSMRVCFVARN